MRALFIFAAMLALTHAGPVKEASEQLEKAKAFAFGGVGFAGTISAPEKAFMVIYAKPDAAKLFEMIYEKGTVQAKLYCLAAWHEIDKTRFEKFGAQLSQENPKAEQIMGCIIMDQNAKEIVGDIRKGIYTAYLKKAAEREKK